MHAFVLDQLDRAGLGHHVFGEDALALVARSSEGLLRRARNSALGSLVERRAQSRTVTIEHVNRVLAQPHYRSDHDHPTVCPRGARRQIQAAHRAELPPLLASEGLHLQPRPGGNFDLPDFAGLIVKHN